MSEYVFKLPDLGEGTVESEIAEWMVKVGDQVQEEDPICSVLTDKAAVEISAPVSGRVTSLAGELGDVVPVGSPLITFDVNGAGESGSNSESSPNRETIDVPVETASAAAAKQSVKTEPVTGQLNESPTLGSNGKVMTSPSIRRRARDADVDLSQVEGSGPRGRILKVDFEAHLGNKSFRAGLGKHVNLLI